MEADDSKVSVASAEKNQKELPKLIEPLDMGAMVDMGLDMPTLRDKTRSMSENELSAVFEGPEKVLEIDVAIGSGPSNGLRTISRKQWDELLITAKCCILDVCSNKYFDSYVLSESSLFVFPWKLIIKTCGKTTLLKIIPYLQEICNKLGIKMEWMQFSRKNLSFPLMQEHPHKCFSAEVEYLKAVLRYGEGHILGPLTSDHWYLYVAELSDEYTHEDTEFKFDVMMYDLDPECCKHFFSNEARTNIQVREYLQLEQHLSGATIHDVLFKPCGYSMNALQEHAYYTMHVTPESEFSYASFESNVQMPDYRPLIEYVLSKFKPKRFTITTFRDCDVEGTGNPLACKMYGAKYKKYRRANMTESQFFECYTGGVANYRDVSSFAFAKRHSQRYLRQSSTIKE